MTIYLLMAPYLAPDSGPGSGVVR